MAKSKDTHKFVLRSKPTLIKKVARLAKQHGTSMNQTINSIITDHFNNDSVQKKLDRILAEVAA